MWLYYNKNKTLEAELPHGDVPVRQGNSFKVYLVTDIGVLDSADVVFLKIKQAGATEYDSINVSMVSGGESQPVFQKAYSSEITYSLQVGARYDVREFEIPASDTVKDGSMYILPVLADGTEFASPAKITVEKTYGRNSTLITETEYKTLLRLISGVVVSIKKLSFANGFSGDIALSMWRGFGIMSGFFVSSGAHTIDEGWITVATISLTNVALRGQTIIVGDLDGSDAEIRISQTDSTLSVQVSAIAIAEAQKISFTAPVCYNAGDDDEAVNTSLTDSYYVTNSDYATDKADIEQSMSELSQSVDQKIAAVTTDLTSVYIYKGNVQNYASLPTTGLSVGYVYNITDANGNIPAGTNYAWNGTGWDALGGTVDLSAYALKTYVDAETIRAEASETTLQSNIDSVKTEADANKAKIENDEKASSIVTNLGTTPVNRATGDKNGNDITTTYLPLAGGTMAGSIGFPNETITTDNLYKFGARGINITKYGLVDPVLQRKYILPFDEDNDVLATRSDFGNGAFLYSHGVAGTYDSNFPNSLLAKPFYVTEQMMICYPRIISGIFIATVPSGTVSISVMGLTAFDAVDGDIFRIQCSNITTPCYFPNKPTEIKYIVLVEKVSGNSMTIVTKGTASWTGWSSVPPKFISMTVTGTGNVEFGGSYSKVY